MRTLIIGAGGIGSFFIEELFNCIDQLQIDTEVTLVDDDIVEINQVKYQNFTVKDAGQNKAKILAKRFGGNGDYIYSGSRIQANTKRITKTIELRGYDVIVLCVDNDKVRKLVIEYCHEDDTEFLDLRATGRKVFCAPKLKTLAENLKYIDETDTNTYSCQDKKDLKKGFIQKGHLVAAMIGVQMLLNISRGHDNRIINLTI
jgi:tRNA A37 threonylcarbamoyladenosine dehydratase